jgi:uncharacterized protein YdiU (UPF0061 family)
METYDPEWTSNPTDIDKQYRFENQPTVVYWNLGRLGRTFIELIGQSWGNTFSLTFIVPTLPIITRHLMQEADIEVEEKLASLPPKKELKHGFIFNPTKSENIVREILFEFDEVFNSSYVGLMCQVKQYLV